jgi:hypothetical protein
MTLDFGIIKSGLFPESDVSGQGMGADVNSSIIWNDVGIGIVPIGGVVAWLKTLTGCPALLPNWVECNGQVLSDGESPFNTQTIPNLNNSGGGGAYGFLRGSTTSGTTGGGSHNHGWPSTKKTNDIGYWPCCLGGQNSNAAATLPLYYEVVWIMRIK